ncbi:MAG: hypothetical protein H6623_02225 [Bdellovibrionaceae bacterium]|nr:hypothetical protein [Pseudobdellovibrionaceae bacterium]
MSSKHIACITFSLLLPFPTALDFSYLFIVWNVGQGAWSTLIDNNYCIHVDMGGEFYQVVKMAQRYCVSKKNVLLLTHLDRDHRNFIPNMQKRIALCLFEKTTYPLDKRITLTNCNQSHLPWIKRVFTSHFKVQNEGHAFLLFNTFLITGDLPAVLENKISGSLDKIRFLLVGHHGSKTSSSLSLLHRLTNLESAIVSARKHKYGHPHFITQKKFRDLNVPLVDTETYGTLVFDISSYYTQWAVKEERP